MSHDLPLKTLIVAVVCLLTGCTVITYRIGQEEIDLEDVPYPGQSRELTDVLAAFGPPNRLSALPGGYVLAWENWYIRQNKLGLSLRPLGVEFLSVDWGAALTRGDFLVLHFNGDHELVASGYAWWDGSAGGGQGVQPLFGLVDVADVDDLTGPMPHHGWGGFGLDELPVTLNADSHMDAGHNGIQQRGTPDGAGQHTLEMR